MFGALFDFDGRPVDLPPGALDVRILGRAGHVALFASPSRTWPADFESSGIEGLANRYWIAGRFRLDAREGLKSKLGARLAGEAAPGDARLCLHAYAAWGEDCLDAIDGDFAFLLWDDERQALFGACDRLGRRSLFHGRAGAKGWAGDSLDWIAGQGLADGGLDDYWIADRLTLNCNREARRTVYRDISRLEPAHCLTWSASGTREKRYWRLDIAEPLYLPRRRDYVDRLRELVGTAIADRLPAGKVGIAMSGGLDSTMLAASAVAVTGQPSRVTAYCEHYEELMHIGEDKYAAMAARHLGIGLRIEPVDRAIYDPQWQTRGIRSQQPTSSILNAHCTQGINDALAQLSPVWLEGEGPDNALTLDRNAYLSWLWRRRDWARLGSAILDYATVKGRAGWKETLRRRTGPVAEPPEPALMPAWLAPDFVSRIRLEERIADLGFGGDTSHPWHPDAMSSFSSAIWTEHFGEYDFQESLSPLVWRSPFLDLRVLTFMLSAPPIPWGWKKHLQREALRGVLPDALIERPKTPLPVHPLVEILRLHGLPPLLAPDRLRPYLDVGRLPEANGAAVDLLQSISVYALDYWVEMQ